MASTRTMVRKSLLAAILSYLRDGSTDTSNFGTYPKEQHIYSFSIGSDLWQLAYTEAGELPIVPGLTIEFETDSAVDVRAMPQKWITTMRFRIIIPRDFRGSSTAQDIAQKVDGAFHDCSGRIAIKDYDATPVTSSGYFLEMQEDSRGEWEDLGRSKATDLQLVMRARYVTASF